MFKDKIKELREINNISQKEMAKRLQVSKRMIIKWERGRCIPSNISLKEICKLFEIDEEVLLNREEMKEELKKLETKRKKVLWFVLGLIIPVVLFLLSLFPMYTYSGFCLWVQPPQSILSILFLCNKFIAFLTIAIYLYVFAFTFIYWNVNLKRVKLIQTINIVVVIILFIITTIIASDNAFGIAYSPVFGISYSSVIM